MSRRAPVIAIGLEVAGPEQLAALAHEGHLPGLDALRGRGAFAPLRSVTEISSGSIWPSFATGVGPAQHGQFFTHMQLQSGTYRIEKQYADDVPCDPFWLDASRAGRRVVVIDVPQTRPLQGLEGAQLCGWGAEYPAWKRSSWPAGLMREILRVHGPHPLADRYQLSIAPRTPDAIARTTAALLHGARTKAAITRELQQRYDPDLLVAVFPETHWAMHLLWQLADPSHPDYDPGLAPRFGGFFAELFETLDAEIAALAARRPEAVVVIFSLSGMGGNFAAWHLLPEVLERLGVGPPAAEAPAGLASWLPSRRFGASRVRGVEDALSLRVIETAKRLAPTRLWDRTTRRILFAGSRWAQSRAFCVPNDYSGAIRVNLRGREPRGRVAPGAEYETLCREIAAALLELEDPATGRPVVREVVRTREVLRGERLEALPDLLVYWASERPVDAVRSSRLGTIARPFPERRTGAHRARGFLVAAGPGIAARGALPEVHTLDLAPTLLALCGVRPPDRFEGAVVPGLLANQTPARAAATS